MLHNQVISPTLRERFNAAYRVDVGGCWEWVKGKTGRGRPSLYIGKVDGKDTQQYAHRVSYELHRGEIPEGMMVCHHCDNPGCVNPDHLFVGTAMDNRQDMVSKGRDPRGEDHSEAIKRGSTNASNAAKSAATANRHRQRRVQAGVPTTYIYCPSCKEWKSQHGFHKNTSTERGYASHCKNCRSHQRRKAA